ncbi:MULTISPECIES: type III secretion system cytoplasmic ring protein SctQ [Candidatus Ichthyocystis]|uniref:Putative type III secretion system protein Q n=1 Tax=Candidatus Ichthyocystis hellenicum TaxID=1561003 RepID=A0A0S4M4I3_9BURK|nr:MULTISPECIES: type III secretion system cytoplasmic ring protein SctQ [Ichthyocystis]CUT17064.1 putative type III secretion system protein Q [Candidatus Ichthyocystis hellenicum]
MAGLPLKLHRLTKRDRALTNVISGRIFPVPFSLQGDWTFSFSTPRPNVTYNPDGYDCWVVDFFWSKGFFSLAIPEFVFCSCLEDWLGDKSINIPSLDGQVLLAVVDAVADKIIETLSRMGFGSVRLNSVTNVPKGEVPKVPPGGKWLEAELNHISSGQSRGVLLHVDNEGAVFLKKVLSMFPLVENGVSIDDVPVSLRFLLGATTLSSQDWRQVERNDVILFDDNYLQDNILFVRVGEYMGFRALWKDNQLIVQTKLGMVMGQKFDDNFDDFWDDDDTTLLSDDDDDEIDFDDDDFDDDDDDDLDRDDDISERLSTRQTPAISTADLSPTARIDSSLPTTTPNQSDLPVRLTFDVGGRRVKFKDLGSICPGYVFDLGRPLNSAVSIRANSKVIAEGELVDIDGHLGVSVTSLKN